LPSSTPDVAVTATTPPKPRSHRHPLRAIGRCLCRTGWRLPTTRSRGLPHDRDRRGRLPQARRVSPAVKSRLVRAFTCAPAAPPSRCAIRDVAIGAVNDYTYDESDDYRPAAHVSREVMASAGAALHDCRDADEPKEICPPCCGTMKDPATPGCARRLNEQGDSQSEKGDSLKLSQGLTVRAERPSRNAPIPEGRQSLPTERMKGKGLLGNVRDGNLLGLTTGVEVVGPVARGSAAIADADVVAGAKLVVWRSR
jgi:hypothetical protein